MQKRNIDERGTHRKRCLIRSLSHIQGSGLIEADSIRRIAAVSPKIFPSNFATVLSGKKMVNQAALSDDIDDIRLSEPVGRL
jgi:hypothetical protein